MPEPFKNVFNTELITLMGQNLKRVDLNFDQERFTQLASEGLYALELKQRAEHIRKALLITLPEDFKSMRDILQASLHPVCNAVELQMNSDETGLRGWAIMPMAQCIAERGLDHFDEALDVLADMTKRFTSEFAVRPFFNHDPERALAKAQQWVLSDNRHLRRLASEGSRPRLPWGEYLKAYIKDPSPLISLLYTLRDDESDYVRRSVANALNDIAKDHPDTIAFLTKEWLVGADKNRTKLLKHACRTLIKQGHQETLSAFGYGPAQVKITSLTLSKKEIQLGEHLNFKAGITSKASNSQELIIDYIIHHRKANGSTSAKTFKWKNLCLKAGETKTLEKKHPIKPITTRTYHAGLHALELQINGARFDKVEFMLQIEQSSNSK